MKKQSNIIKRLIRNLIPRTVLMFAMRRKGRIDLKRINRIVPDISNLSQEINEHRLREILRFVDIENEWIEDSREISSFSIAETAEGVNCGDRRAIYYLLRYFRPKSVLEIGTNVGASTSYAAAALRRNRTSPVDSSRLVTVDICDVNHPTTQPWINWGSTHSPKEMVQKLGAAGWVTFVTAPSLEFFSRCRERYDFIFLDGDHSGKSVYREIPAALDHLNPNGVILLHDYFPSGKPLWVGKSPILGPWLAAQRFQSEGSQFKILPLAELPWPTKFNSNITSLALLVR